MTIDQKQNQIIQQMSKLDDWFDIYEYLIDLGRKHPPIDDSLKNQANALPGCQSKVWITAQPHNGTLHFSADSESTIVKGILALLLQVLNDQPPADIASSNVYFTEKIGLNSNLSPSRANGLTAILAQFKYYAQANLQ